MPNTLSSHPMSTATLRASRGFRLHYRRTAMRLIGRPTKIESGTYDLPLAKEATDQLDGFRQACEEQRYVVVILDLHGKRSLRAWSPTMSALFKKPLTSTDEARAARFRDELAALGYTVTRYESPWQVTMHATRQPSGDAA